MIYLNPSYFNADYRIFDFAENTDPTKPKLVEWRLTQANGGGMGRSPKGPAPIRPRDFPGPEREAEEEQRKGAEEGLEHMENLEKQTSREATQQVPHI